MVPLEAVRKLPVDMLEVVSRSLGLRLFQVGAGTLVGNAQPLEPETLLLLLLSTLPEVSPQSIGASRRHGARGPGWRAVLRPCALCADPIMDAIWALEVGPDLADRPIGCW